MMIRSTKEVIDDALEDNRAWEWLCFGLVILLVVSGLSAFVFGIIQDKAVITITGGGVTGLFWPALTFARKFRKDNIRIRLYEIPISQATTPAEAIKYLREAVK